MNATQVAILEQCALATEHQPLGGSLHGNAVVNLTDSNVIKWGYGAFEQEYWNQRKAYQLLDHRIFRVPKVFDFFEDDTGQGYLVMESTAGEKKRRIEDQGDLEALVRVLQHFATVRSPTPGPLAGPGPAYALLFGDSDLLDNNRAFAFSPSDICLCHLDFFPHNIKWQRGEPPCALDWLSAGFWPHIFEKCSHLIIEDGSIPVFGQMWFPGTDCEQIVLVVEAWSNIRRDHFWACSRHSHVHH